MVPITITGLDYLNEQYEYSRAGSDDKYYQEFNKVQHWELEDILHLKTIKSVNYKITLIQLKLNKYTFKSLIIHIRYNVPF